MELEQVTWGVDMQFEKTDYSLDRSFRIYQEIHLPRSFEPELNDTIDIARVTGEFLKRKESC